jgi:alpha-methylacyl-CoA racemase
LEIAGLGAAPFGVMMLADAGADVLRIDRLIGPAGAGARPGEDPSSLIERGRRGNAVGRSRRSVAVDLKHLEGVRLVLDLASRADIVVEGFRPGVAERLGIGPEPCLEANPALVYGRLTGWGQDGDLAGQAGHDINYLAVSGTLSLIGAPDGAPVVPLNLVADFGGGGMVLAFGVLAALTEARATGRGQVVDAAMVDGAASLATYIHSMRAAGTWVDRRGANVLDGGAPFYGVYVTADGGYMAVGAIEAKFYQQLLVGLGLSGADLPGQLDRVRWGELRRAIAGAFAARPTAHWAEVFATLDACVTPVVTAGNAPDHPHLRARATFIDVDGAVQPAPVPRYQRPAAPPTGPVGPGVGGAEALAEWGIDADRLAALAQAGCVSAS